MASDATSVESRYSLYPYQRQVASDVLRVLRPAQREIISSDRRVVAHMPTGSGKTRVACHVACRLLSDLDAEGKLVVWLASTEELCEQAAEDLAAAWSNLGNRKVHIHRYWGASEELPRLTEGFLVAGLPKLWALGTRRANTPNESCTRCCGCHI